MPSLLDSAVWAEHRAAVFGAAYRILGSVADAEDIVQEVWLRAHRADLSQVRDLRAWLVTVAARRSYDELRSARARRETYVGPWLPEPLLTGPDAAEPVLLDELVSTAVLLVMEELTPSERVALVLHDAFGLAFAEIAPVLGGTPAAARQHASRARRRIAAARERQVTADRAEHARVLAAFRSACENGDLPALVRLLHPDAVYLTDGGGQVHAARKPITGGARIAEVLLRVARRRFGGATRAFRPIEAGGEPALLVVHAGRPLCVDTLSVEDGRITVLHRLLNPDKLRHLPPGL
ncbi:RNA polymerase sigma factor SigJ [Streptomyces xiamenensis]